MQEISYIERRFTFTFVHDCTLAFVGTTEMAGEKIENILTVAPGNKAAIGGVKVETKNGWFAARPSGTEEIYKIYGESFLGKDHLDEILKQAQEIVNNALAAPVSAIGD